MSAADLLKGVAGWQKRLERSAADASPPLRNSAKARYVLAFEAPPLTLEHHGKNGGSTTTLLSDMKPSFPLTAACSAAFVLTSLVSASADVPGPPPGVVITSESKTHVQANLSEVEAARFPSLKQIHALFTVYFDGDGATDEKLKALAQLRFTNLVCVVFTDCHRVTDKGIEYVAQIPTVTNLGLRGMSITDAACATMASRIRLGEVNMRGCPNVTVDGLLKMAQSKTIHSLGFSVGKMSQADVIRIVNAAGPKLNRMDIDMDAAAEGRLDFPALRNAATTKSITLYAVRNHSVRKL